MTEPLDPLETELAALRPTEVSPALRRRIGERLADPRHPRRRIWRIVLAGGLAAAVLAAVFNHWGGDRVPRPGSGPGPVVTRPHTPSPAGVERRVDDPEPTLLAYERALAHSPEDVDALLRDRATGPRQEPARIGAFTRSDASLRPLLGED